eukprot:CAMPEP_0181379906 /NCGR_PEP_ID=MMETSP1106-20121128/19247_1 /TAXON_ID=81844 /ORGANISM="Mantoniella antarctica, Strain SL-175" /LENGTH=518 /DNA_ID=CAMNT_0023498873 /DNA_START=15 /DNA_END=1571 /DNA_ORIENTATION=+
MAANPCLNRAATAPRLRWPAASPRRLMRSNRAVEPGFTGGGGGEQGSSSSASKKALSLRLEKASQLRTELEGIQGRSRRLLARGGRLVERGAALKAAAESAMQGMNRDENTARRLLTERKKVRDTLDVTMARAEVLQQLSNKIEISIIVLEHATDEDDDADAAATAPAALPASSTLYSQPLNSMSQESLEKQFSKLEVNQLERMLQMSTNAPRDDDNDDKDSGSGTSTSTTDGGDEGDNLRDDALQVEDSAAHAERKPGPAEPAWWQPPSELLPAAASAPLMQPLDALLEVDRARVSSAGVKGRHVVALRLSCAQWGAQGIAASDRLVGGKRGTAFRAGVDAAVAAVESGAGLSRNHAGLPDRQLESGDAPGGRGESVVNPSGGQLGCADSSGNQWGSLGGYPPRTFLSDLARDLGMPPDRAGNFVNAATERRAASRLLQAGAHVRAGDTAAAEAEVAALAGLLAAFGELRGGQAHLEVVAFGLERQLSTEERTVVLNLTAVEVDPEVRRAIACALGM